MFESLPTVSKAEITNVLLTALYGGEFGGEGGSDGGITQFYYLYLILFKFP